MGATMVGGWSYADATKYKKVTAMTDLGDGDVVVLVNENKSMVSGSLAGKYINAVAAEVADGYASVAETTEITLGQSGANWTLTCGTKKIANNSSVDFNADGKGTDTYTISFDKDGNVIIASTVASNGTIYFNASQPRFKTYTSTSMAKIQLYKKVEGSNPVMTLSASMLAFDKKALAEGTATDQKTLTITASDLKNENISITMKKGTVFRVTPASVASTGGTVTVAYTATAEGEYMDTVVVTGKDMNDTPIVRECAVSVTIDAAAPTGTNVTYNQLQKIDDLHVGDKVFIGTAAKDFVLGLYDYSVASSNIRGAAATYSTDRHQVTANDLYAYTVSMDANGMYVFTGSDNKYLCDYNSGKNLSSSETLDNKAKWTVTITDDVATIKNVNAATYQLLFNKTAPNAMFCCYTGIDSNTATVVIYSNNAPEYQEKVLEPELNVLVGGETVGETLDWGEVVYDDSWGTEVAPYSQMMEINIVGKDLSENVTLALTKGTDFTIYTTSITPKDGSVNSKVSINFEVNKEGEYSDVLTITCGTMTKTLNLKAKAVKEASDDPSTKPQITTDKVRVYLNPYYAGTGTTSVMDMFTFSATNLTKKLYVEWVKNNSEPTSGYGKIEVLVGDQQINAGEKAQFDGPTVENTEVYIAVDAYGSFSYSTTLHFFTYAEDKVTIAAERLVDLVINVTTYETPDPDPTHDPNVNPSTDIQSTRVVKNGQAYNLLGQPVGKGYQGIVILDGEKKVW